MLGWFVFLSMLASSSQLSNEQQNKNEINALIEFLKIQGPAKIVTFLCSKQETFRLMKDFNENSKFIVNYDYKNSKWPIQQHSENLFYVLDMSCDYSTNILDIAQELGLFLFPLRWIILNGKEFHNLENNEKYKFPLNSRVYIFEEDENNIRINSIYNINDFRLNNDVALWDGARFVYYNPILDASNRSSLMKVDMNISVVVLYEDTLDHFDDMRNRHLDSLSKHNYILVKLVAEFLNATAHFLHRPAWGSPNETTGIFDGMVGDLQVKQAEIAGTVGFITYDRIKFMDYVAYTTPTAGRFIYRAPPLSVVSNVFTLPFNTWVWYACYGILIVICFVMYIIIKWEWHETEFESTITDKHGVLRPRIMDVIQMEIGAICQQGSEAEPKSVSGRFATFLVFLALMFLYTSYAANIVALLQSTTDSINSLEAILNSRMKVGVEGTPYNKYFFKVQSGDVHRALYNTKVVPRNKPDNFMDINVGVDRMRNEFFAIFAECDSVYKIVSNTFLETEKCGLMELDFWTLAPPYIPIVKNSSYRDLIKIGYAKLNERGLQKRSFKRFYIGKPSCANPGANFVSVSVNDCYFALMIYGIGLGVATSIFGMEIISKKYNKKIKFTR